MNLVSLCLALFCFAPFVPHQQALPPLDDPGTASHVFYAEQAKVGDVYAGMTLTSLDVNLETNDVTAQFTGEATITGTYEVIPDDDEFFSGVSFEVDSASIPQLPVLATDERDKKWFIFVNEDHDSLLAAFGNPQPGVKGKATVVISDYRINHLHKEIADTAKLVNVIRLE
ncbi:hypothetical protein [Brevibacillus marinus]|uniref:hypothetical protein n=1 Tax=Brevibacillus marinus TaxID=2496837 RepID=UPI000F825D9F|nr:hypothetical protein [Brevibacillus marinus]